MTITLGSLFDGIGVFPLAASRHGITPVWASGIIPDAISITKRHFPKMVHLGDITKLDGGKIPAVHVITFGSPCQNLSSIGPRDGLAGAKSSLFYQAIRIIEEMRDASGGLYPAIIIGSHRCHFPGGQFKRSGRQRAQEEPFFHKAADPAALPFLERFVVEHLQTVPNRLIQFQ